MKEILASILIILGSISIANAADTKAQPQSEDSLYDSAKSGWNKMLDQVAPPNKPGTTTEAAKPKPEPKPQPKPQTVDSQNQEKSGSLYESIKSGWNKMLNAIAPPGKQQ